jgi:hypothetical protein
MWVDRAIFTSLSRDGRSGYHVVGHTAGVADAELRVLGSWFPTEGSLISEPENPCSVNGLPLPTGRYVLSRTCAGPPEYSGRGGRQLYTSALILDPGGLAPEGSHPLALYRSAMALGLLVFREAPPRIMEPAWISDLGADRGSRVWLETGRSGGQPRLDHIVAQLDAGTSLVIPHSGSRLAFADCLLGAMAPSRRFRVSFTTSLRVSAARPVNLALVAEGLAH